MTTRDAISKKIRLKRIFSQKEYYDNTCIRINKNFELHLAHKVQHHIEKKSFKITLLVAFNYEDYKFAEYLYDFIFEVDTILEFITKVDGDQVFSGQIIGALIDISYSTLRGLLYTKLSETNLNGFILPIISPTDILKYTL